MFLFTSAPASIDATKIFHIIIAPIAGLLLSIFRRFFISIRPSIDVEPRHFRRRHISPIFRMIAAFRVPAFLSSRLIFAAAFITDYEALTFRLMPPAFAADIFAVALSYFQAAEAAPARFQPFRDAFFAISPFSPASNDVTPPPMICRHAIIVIRDLLKSWLPPGRRHILLHLFLRRGIFSLLLGCQTELRRCRRAFAATSPIAEPPPSPSFTPAFDKYLRRLRCFRAAFDMFRHFLQPAEYAIHFSAMFRQRHAILPLCVYLRYATGHAAADSRRRYLPKREAFDAVIG